MPSSGSAAKAAESDLSIPEIAEKLGADVVLDGSFTREGNHIKLTATLVDGASDRNIWVSDFECEIQDLFSLQNEIALAIENRDCKSIASHAHALKGVGRNLGMEQLSEIASKIEEASRRNDVDLSIQRLNDLKTEVDAVLLAFSKSDWIETAKMV